MDAFTIPQVAELSGLTAREVRLWIEHGRLRPLPGVWPRRIARAELERSGIVHQGKVLGDQPPDGDDETDDADSLAKELRALRRRLAEADAQAARALMTISGENNGRFERDESRDTVVRPALFQLFTSSEDPESD